MENFKAAEILLVEDNPQDAELTIRALRKNNLANQIHIAEDGEEALDYIFCKGQYSERLFTKSPKVIFLDLKLPKISGLEVLERLKSDLTTKTLPIVVITSSRENPDIKRAYELGVNSYVVKPVDFDDFSNAMAQTGLFWLLVNEVPTD